MKIEEKLNRLAELQQDRDGLDAYFEDLKSAILTPELKQALADFDAKKAIDMDAIKIQIDALTAEIKEDVIRAGTTVKGNLLIAVWNKGRISWDGKGLAGYEVAHPEIAAFKSVGEPSVTIRKV